MFKSRSRAIGTLIVLSMILVASFITLPAKPALAHHPILSATGGCLDDGSQYIDWKVENGNWGKTMTFSGSSSEAGFTVGGTIADDGDPMVFRQSFSGSFSGPVTLTVTASWQNGPQNVSRSTSFTLGGDCAPPPYETCSVTGDWEVIYQSAQPENGPDGFGWYTQSVKYDSVDTSHICESKTDFVPYQACGPDSPLDGPFPLDDWGPWTYDGNGQMCHTGTQEWLDHYTGQQCRTEPVTECQAYTCENPGQPKCGEWGPWIPNGDGTETRTRECVVRDTLSDEICSTFPDSQTRRPDQPEPPEWQPEPPAVPMSTPAPVVCPEEGCEEATCETADIDQPIVFVRMAWQGADGHPIPGFHMFSQVELELVLPEGLEWIVVETETGIWYVLADMNAAQAVEVMVQLDIDDAAIAMAEVGYQPIQVVDAAYAAPTTQVFVSGAQCSVCPPFGVDINGEVFIGNGYTLETLATSLGGDTVAAQNAWTRYHAAGQKAGLYSTEPLDQPTLIVRLVYQEPSAHAHGRTSSAELGALTQKKQQVLAGGECICTASV